MNIRQYLEAKYGAGLTGSMLGIEARALRIKMRRNPGWLEKYGHIEIEGETLQRLKLALQNSKKPSARRGLAVLAGSYVKADHYADEQVESVLRMYAATCS